MTVQSVKAGFFLALAVLLAAGPAGCRREQAASTSAGGGARARALIYGRGNDSRTLDPFMADEGETTLLIDNLYEPLVRFAVDSTDIDPSLATDWSVSEDQLTWTFTLRAGVTFHNGDPLTAEDVRFTLDRLVSDDNEYRFGQVSPYAYLYDDFDTVTALDERHVQVTLKRPSAVVLANLAMFPASIVSKRAVLAGGGQVRGRCGAAAGLQRRTGATLAISLGFILVNLLVDVTYALIDPRIRRSG